ncbi:hypothetical protein ACSBM8_13320 [Sphingomonas sp. ASY06-1R]|uniref:hypothetical protein n=1 Tax=Sphingomonas sp. ASY06-1R TaxID=3445771 RepID=UPI003FA22C10
MVRSSHRHWRLIGALILSAASSCHAVDNGKAPKADQAREEKQVETVGAAMREADGTYILQLRATSDGGDMGDALIRYRRGDKDYDAIARHVGPVPVGQWVLVKPFPK